MAQTFSLCELPHRQECLCHNNIYCVHMSFSRELIETVGFVAGALTTASFLPQLVAVYRQKSAKDLSWSYLAMFTTGVSLWEVYGFMLSAPPIIAANAVTLALLGCIMALKIKYHH